MTWRLKEILDDLGLTQEKAAELLDCSIGQLNMLISGKRKFHSGWIERISEKLKIPAWQLFVDPAEVISEDDKRLTDAYHSLSKDLRRAVDAILFK